MGSLGTEDVTIDPDLNCQIGPPCIQVSLVGAGK